MTTLFAIVTRPHVNFSAGPWHITFGTTFVVSDSTTKPRQPASESGQDLPSLSQASNIFIPAEYKDCQDLANIYRCLRQKVGLAQDEEPSLSRMKSLELGRCSRCDGSRSQRWALEIALALTIQTLTVIDR